MSVVGSLIDVGRESELDGFELDDHDTASQRDGGDDQAEPDGIAKNETKAVNWLRILVALVLLATTVVVSVTAFLYLKRSEEEKFEATYYDHATRVIDAIRIKSDLRIGTIRNFAESLTSHSSFHELSWPNVTLPDFERQGTATARLADVMSLILAPLVTDLKRERWEAYSVENQGWLVEGLEVQKEEEGRGQIRSTIGNQTGIAIPEQIHRVEGLAPAAETGPGPFLPQWQIAPALPVGELVNFNLLSHPSYKQSLASLLRIRSPVVGRSFDFSDVNDIETVGRRDIFELFLQKWQQDRFYGDDPVADLHWPIFDSFDEASQELVGLLTCVIYWRTYFEDILAENSILDVVIDNTCGQTYAYQINGPEVAYIGPGDQHNRKYDRFEVASEFGAYLKGDTTQRNTDGSCLYAIHVYPAEEFEDIYVTSKPAIYTSILVLIFVFTSGVFVVYDCLVERRQRVVMDTAVASTAIVSSLFPKNVRDRIYQDRDDEADAPTEHSTVQQSADNIVMKGEDFKDDRQESVAGSIAVPSSKPIADLFKNCTVLFAGIVGFTSWSSGREPTDVFFLLETIYGEFDKIASKRRVFKVETIGDCYLAVTGLPERQADHATRIALFAHECLRKMKMLLAKDLRTSLGGDTSSLAMRFGLHSGPVTAGVLRGEKSRFQLFGDTVNTAARMESTGRRNQIQLSLQAADLLLETGKGHWLNERADKVEAKGKGVLQTFWLKPRAYQPSRDGEKVDHLKKSAHSRREELGSIDDISESQFSSNELESDIQKEEEAEAVFNRTSSRRASDLMDAGGRLSVPTSSEGGEVGDASTPPLANPQEAALPLETPAEM